MSREFKIEREIELPGTPGDVWRAVATAAGNSAWLFASGVGADESNAEAWDPPHHLAVRTQQGEWFNALEFKIEARDGSHTTLRYAHSGIFMEDWENQYDAADKHTDFYLHTLDEYLRHYNGRTATYIGDAPAGIEGPPSSNAPDGFTRVQQALGFRADTKEGDAVRLTPAGFAPIDGVIDYRRPDFIGIRTSDALIRLFGRNAFGQPVAMSVHDFSGRIDAVHAKQVWKRWLDDVFAAGCIEIAPEGADTDLPD